MAAAQIAKVFQDFRVEDRGADFIDAGGPLAEVDFAAAVAAKGEVFVSGADEHAAGGATEEPGGFFLLSHGCFGARMAAKRYGIAWDCGRADFGIGWSDKI
jgi:hypothetical protein